MDKYLIINADDFGMCHAHNVATFDLLKMGAITSSTIMACCPWAYEAAMFAKANPQFAIGVHLTNTSEWGTYRWPAVTGAASLSDRDGFMHGNCIGFTENAHADDARRELIAQIERLKGWGFRPSHADNHMGSMYGIHNGRFELLETVLEVAAQYGLPFRFPMKFSSAQYENGMFGIRIPMEQISQVVDKFTAYGQSLGVAMPDYLIPGDWNGPQKDSYENYREYIYELYRTFEPGVTETYIHPAAECDELKAVTGSWQRRVWEYRLFSDPKTRQHIDALGIRLINYRDLKKMRGF